jgi:putative peptidoglycan lipid II flippase
MTRHGGAGRRVSGAAIWSARQHDANEAVRRPMSTNIVDSPPVEPAGPDEMAAALDAAAHQARGDATRRGIVSAALIITIGNLLSRIFGLVREALASYYFGTGAGFKPFALADSMLTILYDLLISGMVAAALVPVFSEYVAPERREELRRVVGTLLLLALAVIGSVTVLLEIFATPLVRLWLGSGSAGDVALLPETVKNIRLILPAAFLLGFSAIVMAANYALGRFAWPSASQAARNGAIIVAAVALHRALGVTSMVVGVLLGAVLLVVIQLPGLRDALPKLAFDLRHPAIRRIFVLYAPIFLGLFASTFGQLVDRHFAWNAGEDALGAMRYATQIQQLVLGLVATGISLGALPALARQAAAGDDAGFQTTFATALRLTTVLIAPAAFGLLALASPLGHLIFRHGATSNADARLIVIALIGYVPGTFFQAYDQLLINVFYARHNTLTPQLVGVASVVLYIGVEVALVGRFGMVALVGAISVQWTFHALVMFWLGRRLLTAAHWRAFRRALAVCVGVSVVMAALAWAVASGIERTLPGPALIREAAALFVAAGLGALVYAWGVTRLGITEFTALASAILRKAGLGSLARRLAAS